MTEFKNPMTVGALAEHIGCSRHRIYGLISDGTLKPQVATGNYMFSPAYAALIIGAVVYVRTKKRTAIRFNFV